MKRGQVFYGIENCSYSRGIYSKVLVLHFFIFCILQMVDRRYMNWLFLVDNIDKISYHIFHTNIIEIEKRNRKWRDLYEDFNERKICFASDDRYCNA